VIGGRRWEVEGGIGKIVGKGGEISWRGGEWWGFLLIDNSFGGVERGFFLGWEVGRGVRL